MKRDELVVGIIELFFVFVKSIKFIILCAIIGGIIGFFLSSFSLKPKYASFVTFSVNNSEKTDQKLSSSDIYASQLLMPSSAVVMKSNTVLSIIAQQLGDGTTVGQLNQYIIIRDLEDTNILRVSVITQNAKLSYDIANILASIIPEKVSDMMHTGTILVLDDPYYSDRIYSNQPFAVIATAAVLGFVIGCFAVYIIYKVDDRIKSTDEIRRMYSLPILGEIPDYNTGSKIESYGS